MELLLGFPLLINQTLALLKKNVILCARHKMATFLQFFIHVVFMALLFGGLKIYGHLANKNLGEDADPHPKPLINPPIPSCEEKFFIRRPCYDFVWSSENGVQIDAIVGRIMSNNYGRPIPSTKVKAFKTQDEMETWLEKNPMQTPGALHFKELNATIISFGTKTNSINTQIGEHKEDPTLKFQMPLQLAASREIARTLIGDPNFSWSVGLKEFAHPDNYEKITTETKNPNEIQINILFLASTVFSLLYQLNSVVQEKEFKHRQAMTVMGLFDTAYWASWIIWHALLSLVTSLLIMSFGKIVRWDYFTKNNFFLVFLVYYLFQYNLLVFGLMISTFLKKSSSTTIVGFAMLILGIIGYMVNKFDIVYSNGVKHWQRLLLSLFPPIPFFEIQSRLHTASITGNGLTWNQFSTTNPDEDKVPLSYMYYVLDGTSTLWILLTLYFDNVISNSTGAGKSLIYFLKPSYWTGKGEDGIQDEVMGLASIPSQSHDHDNVDYGSVIEEENRTKQNVREGNLDPSVAVQFRGLRKKYSKLINVKWHRRCCCCCFCTFGRPKPFVAVQGLWLNLAKDQLFCLLGHNGAGKTTTISCLTGLTPVTEGDAIVYGRSVRSSGGIKEVRRNMGVCAQFDTLWDVMTGREHLKLFATIKGLPRSFHESESQQLLEQVKLTSAADARSSSYSGGMKRRLSVAIALIGNPKLLILDEPTTGMDPVARNHVWNVIQSAKENRCVILTTHSMDEADILADRIGIMAKGRLRCIGTPTFLKSKFGTGFCIKISFPKTDGEDDNLQYRQAVKEHFQRYLDIVPNEEDKNFLTFVVEREKEEQLEEFLADLEHKENDLGILNLEIGLATLEEVFLNISGKVDTEIDETTGKTVRVTLPSGVTVKVPVGANFIDVPGSKSLTNPTGLRVEFTWKKDERGNLVIADISSEMPAPDFIPLPNIPGNSS